LFVKNFKPGRGMSIFVIVFFPLLLALGSWQVVRGFEKQDILDQFDFNRSLVPIEVNKLLNKDIEGSYYRTVSLEGQFMEQSYFLDNRIYRQKSGYEIFSLFKSDSNKFFLINRGWLNKKDAIETEMSKKVRIQGLFTPFKRFGLSLSGEGVSYGWPKIVQELSFEQAVRDLSPKYDPQPAVIQLSAGSPGAFEPIWKPTIFKAARHYGYAVQWFGLSLVLLISYIYFGIQRENNDNN
jgi:surfeit locus 1 family protein